MPVQQGNKGKIKTAAWGLPGGGKKGVELRGFEPLAYTLRTYRSSQLSYSPISILNIR